MRAPTGARGNSFNRSAGSLKLTLDEEALVLAADDDGRLEQCAGEPQGGLLEQGLIAHQRQELLGELLPRNGPQAGPGAPTEDYWTYDFSPPEKMLRALSPPFVLSQAADRGNEPAPGAKSCLLCV